jgi:synaptobrevin homolog YKT6
MEYPVRPAFSLLAKVMDDFTAKVPQSSYSNPSSISFPEINAYVQKYQDPRQADSIMRVQQELDETKIVLVSQTGMCGIGCGADDSSDCNACRHVV